MNALADPIRVLIVDDHAVVRIGLRELVAATSDVVAVDAVADGETALAVAAATTPDVVLMDVSMPDPDGIETTRRLMAANPDSRVVMLTSSAEDDRIAAALEAGAIGYILKDTGPDDLLRGIRAAARGEAPLDPRAARVLLAARGRARPAEQLTTREREILVLLTRGLANKQIAWRLGIREKTVKAHLTSIFQRLGVSDRTQAALWAHQQGLGRGVTGH